MKIVKLKSVITVVLMGILILSSTMETQAGWYKPGLSVEQGNSYGDSLSPIMGNSNVTIGQMINYYQAHASYPIYYAQCGSEAPNIYEFCKIYMEECQAEGVRVDVAFCQAMKETGYLRFGGDVSITQFNFAGLGATGNGNPGNSFPTVRMGIRAQVQHLKAYASTDGLVNPCVDGRFQYVSRGSAPYVEWLGQQENPGSIWGIKADGSWGVINGRGWATAKDYGYSIVRDYMANLSSTTPFTTWCNGVDYSSIYDPEYYMLHNPDVVNCIGYNSDGIITHFINNGMREGRMASANFDVYAYRAKYKDLRQAFGYDMKSYYMHYLTKGRFEQRSTTGSHTITDGVTIYGGVDYALVYDYNYYIKNNPDVAAVYGNDDIAVLAHFVNNGMREGRVASPNFDVYAYRAKYRDLRQAFGYDMKLYYMHYLTKGRFEQRSTTGSHTITDGVTIYGGVDYALVYDYNYYIKNNPDVVAVYGNDDIAVLAHFVNNGMAEGRQGRAEFSVQSYKNQYVDLRNVFGNSLKSYYMHYIMNGKKEGRQTTGCTTVQNPVNVYGGIDYSLIYNYYYYIEKYPDIKNAFGNDDVAVLAHFVNNGMAEGRQASEMFNVIVYRNNNADLNVAFGDNLKAYYQHYITFGKNEDRRCK